MIAIPALLVIGVLVAIFVGYNIGGSSTGVAFGPVVGSRIVGKAVAAGIFTAFAFGGGWTIGRNVITTMSEGIVPESQFTLTASIIVLFFAGGGLLVSNFFGVPSSTSMTAVGAIAGLGVATNSLDEQVMFTIVAAWIIAPFVAVCTGLVIGRYLYPHLDARFSFTRFQTHLIHIDRSRRIPLPTLNQQAEPRDALGGLIVVLIACYNAFSAGASNAANAIAPLVGNGSITPSQGILLAIAAIGLGGFTIARRTLDTIGEGLTDLPILAAMIVSLVGATIITCLSYLGIPASLAVSMTSCIIGLGWGRSSRAVTLSEATSTALEKRGPNAIDAVLKKEEAERPELSADAILAESGVTNGDHGPARSPTVDELATGEADDRVEQAEAERASVEVPKIGEESPEELLAETPVLFDRVATGRVVFLWLLTPIISTTGSYAVFVLFF
ncbi:inorganic phosphate transporter [Halocatena pleomorpha]|uniref:Phosphate transporter n=1 Tax=Halocatena pleomorpha TaxID=1785090 RepID=A0A3P3REU6_9EURY|nr:inorganic phosphate transporter [Halocatena pleomorpha]RRJ31488.1 anion permease [Halocatena pleomorpha]